MPAVPALRLRQAHDITVDVGAFDPSEAFTLEAWVRVGHLDDRARLFAAPDYAGPPVRLAPGAVAALPTGRLPQLGSVDLPEGVEAVFFADEGFKGQAWAFRSDQPTVPADCGQARSVVLIDRRHRRQDCVVLFEDAGFQGGARLLRVGGSLVKGAASLGRIGSAWVPPGVALELTRPEAPDAKALVTLRGDRPTLPATFQRIAARRDAQSTAERPFFLRDGKQTPVDQLCWPGARPEVRDPYEVPGVPLPDLSDLVLPRGYALLVCAGRRYTGAHVVLTEARIDFDQLDFVPASVAIVTAPDGPDGVVGLDLYAMDPSGAPDEKVWGRIFPRGEHPGDADYATFVVPPGYRMLEAAGEGNWGPGVHRVMESRRFVVERFAGVLTIGGEGLALRRTQGRVGRDVVDFGGGRLRADRWHHLALTWDGENLLHVLDGKTVREEPASAEMGLRLLRGSRLRDRLGGGEWTLGAGLRGTIAQVWVHARSYSADAIRDHRYPGQDRPGDAVVILGADATALAAPPSAVSVSAALPGPPTGSALYGALKGRVNAENERALTAATRRAAAWIHRADDRKLALESAARDEARRYAHFAAIRSVAFVRGNDVIRAVRQGSTFVCTPFADGSEELIPTDTAWALGEGSGSQTVWLETKERLDRAVAALDKEIRNKLAEANTTPADLLEPGQEERRRIRSGWLRAEAVRLEAKKERLLHPDREDAGKQYEESAGRLERETAQAEIGWLSRKILGLDEEIGDAREDAEDELDDVRRPRVRVWAEYWEPLDKAWSALAGLNRLEARRAQLKARRQRVKAKVGDSAGTVAAAEALEAQAVRREAAASRLESAEFQKTLGDLARDDAVKRLEEHLPALQTGAARVLPDEAPPGPGGPQSTAVPSAAPSEGEKGDWLYFGTSWPEHCIYRQRPGVTAERLVPPLTDAPVAIAVDGVGALDAQLADGRADTTVFWIQADGMLYRATGAADIKALVSTPLPFGRPRAWDLAVDTVNKRLVWSNGWEIWSAAVADGAISDVRILVAHAASPFPVAVAVDRDGAVYWLDAEDGMVRAVRGDGPVEDLYRAPDPARGLSLGFIEEQDASGEAHVLYWSSAEERTVEVPVLDTPGRFIDLRSAEDAPSGRPPHAAVAIDRRIGAEETQSGLRFGADDAVELEPVRLDLAEGLTVSAMLTWDGPEGDTSQSVYELATAEDEERLVCAIDAQGQPSLRVRWGGRLLTETARTSGEVRIPRKQPTRVTWAVLPGGWLTAWVDGALVSEVQVSLRAEPRVFTGHRVGAPNPVQRHVGVRGALLHDDDALTNYAGFRGAVQRLAAWNRHVPSAAVGFDETPGADSDWSRSLITTRTRRRYLHAGRVDGSLPAVTLFAIDLDCGLAVETDLQVAHARLDSAHAQVQAANALAAAKKAAAIQAGHAAVEAATQGLLAAQEKARKDVAAAKAKAQRDRAAAEARRDAAESDRGQAKAKAAAVRTEARSQAETQEDDARAAKQARVSAARTRRSARIAERDRKQTQYNTRDR